MGTNGDTPPLDDAALSGAIAERRTDEFLAHLVHRVGLAQQASEAAIGEVRQQRRGIETLERRFDSFDKRLDIMDTRCVETGRAIDSAAADVKQISNSVADFGSQLILQAASIAAGHEVVSKEVQEVRTIGVENRDAINANPAMPNLPEVSAVHDIEKLMAVQVTAKIADLKLELAKRDVAEATARKDSYRVKVEKADAQRFERLKLIITVGVALVGWSVAVLIWLIGHVWR